jgi:hypothetical protein
MKPFATITVVTLLVVAAAHAYRAATGTINVTVSGRTVPNWISWPVAFALAAFALLLFKEVGGTL